MNPQEQRRIIILTQVVSKTLTVAEAVVQMGVCERQTKRLLAGVAVTGWSQRRMAIGADNPRIPCLRRRGSRCGLWRAESTPDSISGARCAPHLVRGNRRCHRGGSGGPVSSHRGRPRLFPARAPDRHHPRSSPRLLPQTAPYPARGAAVIGETKPGRTLRGDRAIASGVTKSLNNESDRFTGL